MKNCPNCGNDVPDVANLCKHCFHDFHMVVVKRKSPLFPFLLFAIGAAIAVAGAYSYRQGMNRTYRISVDNETKSMVFTTKTATETNVDRVYFKDVADVEYVLNARPRPFEVAVVTVSGERFVYQQAEEPLDIVAMQLSEVIGKPVVRKDQYDTPSVIKKK